MSLKFTPISFQFTLISFYFKLTSLELNIEEIEIEENIQNLWICLVEIFLQLIYYSRTPFEKFIFEIFFRKIDRIPAKSILPKQQGDTWGIHSWLIKILMIKKACFGVVYIGMDFGLSLNKQKRGGCRDRRCTSYVNKGRLNVYRWKPIRNALNIICTAFRPMRRH